jgi:hypothetical protein
MNVNGYAAQSAKEALALIALNDAISAVMMWLSRFSIAAYATRIYIRSAMTGAVGFPRHTRSCQVMKSSAA